MYSKFEEKQARLNLEKQHVQKVEVTKRVGIFARLKQVVAIAAVAIVTMLMPTLAMAQETAPALTDLNKKVTVVELFDYVDLAQSYLGVTGTVMAVLAGVLITIGIGWAFINKLTHRRGV